jgi:hypothetical protein
MRLYDVQLSFQLEFYELIAFDEFELVWEKWLLPVSRRYPDTRLEELRKSTKKQCLGQGSNQVSPECKVEGLQLEPFDSLFFLQDLLGFI